MSKILAALLLLAITTYPASGGYLKTNAPGTIISFAGSTCPLGSIDADGASLLRSGKYANLFTAISTTWGTADGTHFNVPNLLGRFLRGAGTITDSHGGTAVSLGAYQEAETRIYTTLNTNSTGSHQHTFADLIPSRAAGGSDGGGDNNRGLTTSPNTTDAAGTHAHTIAVGEGGAETRPKSYGVKYCIYY